MFFKRRFAIVLSAFAVAVLAVTPPVSAGCLCDWLFGRPTTYAAAMPVTPAPAYAAAMPVTPTPAYSAAMPVSATAPLATVPAQTVPAQTVPAQTVPAQTVPAQTALQPITTAPTSPYTAQMPAYGTAAPLSSGYAGQYSSLYGGTTPVAGSAVAAPAVTAAPITSFYGTGNVYPPIQPTSGYTANYAPGYTAGTAPAYTAAPTYAAAPAVTAVPARTGGLLGGIRGFFGNLFGTNYRTSYYRAPVTYYRPLTTVDPVSGSTVTVQRPCTAYQNQVQRTPYMGLQPAAATPAAACAPTLPPATYSSPAVGTSPAPAWQGGSTYGSGQSLPPQSLPGQPLTGQPLMGQPGQTPSSVPQGDAAPVAPPALQRVPVPSTEAPETPRYWQAPPATTSSAAAPGPARGLPDPPSTYARPIPAPPTPWAQPSTKSAKPSTSSPQPSTQRDGFGEGGRTASRPAWGFKTIAWNASQDRGVQPAAYQESAYGEPGRYGDQTESALRIGERDTVAEPGRVAEPVRRENWLPNAGAAQTERRQPAMLNAPAQLAPRRNNPPRATQPAFDASHQDDSRNGGYDNSGWRASR